MRAANIALLCATVLSGCAGSQLPEAPRFPSMPTSYAPPPMRSMASAPEVREFPQQKVKVTVGAGNDQMGPQQATLRLASRENVNKILWPNPDLLQVNSAIVGTPREGHSIITFKPLSEVAPTQHDVLIATNLRQIDVLVNVIPGRAKNASVNLGEPKGSRKTATGASGCADTLFSWQRNVYWAPLGVCAYVTPSGSYQTVIMTPGNMQASPTVTAVRDFGQGQSLPSILNYRRREDGAIVVDGIWPVLRLNGEGGSVDIVRGRA